MQSAHGYAAADRVLRAIADHVPLAPLHNPANLLGVRVAMDLLPGVPQVAVFDTAFHQTMPPEAYRYAVPEALYTEARVRRYGFHGTSHRYVTQRAAALLGKPVDQAAPNVRQTSTRCGRSPSRSTHRRSPRN